MAFMNIYIRLSFKMHIISAKQGCKARNNISGSNFYTLKMTGFSSSLALGL